MYSMSEWVVDGDVDNDKEHGDDDGDDSIFDIDDEIFEIEGLGGDNEVKRKYFLPRLSADTLMPVLPRTLYVILETASLSWKPLQYVAWSIVKLAREDFDHCFKDKG